MSNTIQYLPIDHLRPHPLNPRKELGDLTELTESIKANGVYQNLTVVLDDNQLVRSELPYFTIIIGHRRHAAAKEAGLSVLPCVVAEMTEKQQLETMLLENMQRTDLTITEQAQGMQLLIDLGESVDAIAQSTGLSKKTVKNRVRLNQWKMSDVETAFSKGATLEDFANLDKIEDEKEKARVAKLLGTSNFKWELEEALKNQKFAKALPGIIKKLEAAGAEKVKERPEYREYHSRISVTSIPSAKNAVDQNADNRKMVFTINKQWRDVDLYFLYTAEEIAERETEPRNASQKSRELLDKYKEKLIKEIDKYIDAFIADFSDSEYLSVYHGKAKEKDDIIARLLKMIYLADTEIEGVSQPEPLTAMKICGYKRDQIADSLPYGTKDKEGLAYRINDDTFLKNIEQNPIKWLLALLRTCIHVRACAEFYTYSSTCNCVHYTGAKYPRLFIDELKQLGFEEPDEIASVIDGTHPMYTEDGCMKILKKLTSADQGGAQ